MQASSQSKKLTRIFPGLLYAVSATITYKLMIEEDIGTKEMCECVHDSLSCPIPYPIPGGTADLFFRRTPEDVWCLAAKTLASYP